MYDEVFIQRKLQDAEYNLLLDRAYFKLRLEVDCDRLNRFNVEYHVGDEIVFHSPHKADVMVKISSIDLGELSGSNRRVFVGFTLI